MRDHPRRIERSSIGRRGIEGPNFSGLVRPDTARLRERRSVEVEVSLAMSWSERLMASLDGRATLLRTERGDVQFARDGQGPQ